MLTSNYWEPLHEWKPKKNVVSPTLSSLTHSLTKTTHWSSTNGWVQEATQIWFGGGCAARASKSITIFKGYFGWKRYPFSGYFCQNIGPFFKILKQKPDSCLGIFLLNMGPVFRNFLWKNNLLELFEYPPGWMDLFTLCIDNWKACGNADGAVRMIIVVECQHLCMYDLYNHDAQIKKSLNLIIQCTHSYVMCLYLRARASFLAALPFQSCLTQKWAVTSHPLWKWDKVWVVTRVVFIIFFRKGMCSNQIWMPKPLSKV